jgi:hypothetical protein
MSALPDPGEAMDRLGLRGKRVRLVVDVNLDPVPGWGNHVEDFRAYLQRNLDDGISHYHPHVTIAEDQP